MNYQNTFLFRTLKEFIDQKTNEDGSDLGAWLSQFFQVLNTPNEKRLKNLDEHLNQLFYPKPRQLFTSNPEF